MKHRPSLSLKFSNSVGSGIINKVKLVNSHLEHVQREQPFLLIAPDVPAQRLVTLGEVVDDIVDDLVGDVVSQDEVDLVHLVDHLLAQRLLDEVASLSP